MTLALNKPKLDNLASDIWKSAERLRGKFKAYEYQNVILPIIVIRRLECVLIAWREAKRSEVLAKRPNLTEVDLDKLVKDLELNPRQSPFSNKTAWTLRKVYEEDHTLLEENFRVDALALRAGRRVHPVRRGYRGVSEARNCQTDHSLAGSAAAWLRDSAEQVFLPISAADAGEGFALGVLAAGKGSGDLIEGAGPMKRKDTALQVTPEYRGFIEDLKARVFSARLSAARAVNRDLILLYWDIGRAIADKQEELGWGESVVKMVASDLRSAFPGTTGFSPQNVWRMLQFYRTHADERFLSQVVREWTEDGKAAPTPEKLSQLVREMVATVPWGHHANALAKVAGPAARLYYLRATARFGWSRNVLLNQIKAGAYERAVAEKKTHNFELALPEHLAEQADEMLKSSYNLEFLGIHQAVKERELEDRLIERLRDFLLELGYGFCFVGRQYRLALGDKEYFIRSALLPPLPQGAGGVRTQGWPIRAGIRGQDGLLPEPPQRQRERSGRQPVHRGHPLRREGRCGGGIRTQNQAKSDRGRGVSPPIQAPGRSEREAADGQTTRRCRPYRPAGESEEAIMNTSAQWREAFWQLEFASREAM